MSRLHRPYNFCSYSMVEIVHILYVRLEFSWEATFASLTHFVIHGRTFLVVALTIASKRATTVYFVLEFIDGLKLNVLSLELGCKWKS